VSDPTSRDEADETPREMHNLLLQSTVSPIATGPAVERFEPTKEAPRAETTPPKLPWATTERASKVPRDEDDKDFPIRIDDPKDTAEPTKLVPRVEVDSPIRQLRSAERLLPKRENEETDTELPKIALPKLDNSPLPVRESLVTLTDSPTVVRKKQESESPKRTGPPTEALLRA
jgi:hypothetical protein